MSPASIFENCGYAASSEKSFIVSAEVLEGFLGDTEMNDKNPALSGSFTFQRYFVIAILAGAIFSDVGVPLQITPSSTVSPSSTFAKMSESCIFE